MVASRSLDVVIVSGEKWNGLASKQVGGEGRELSVSRRRQRRKKSFAAAAAAVAAFAPSQTGTLLGRSFAPKSWGEGRQQQGREQGAASRSGGCIPCAGVRGLLLGVPGPATHRPVRDGGGAVLG